MKQLAHGIEVESSERYGRKPYQSRIGQRDKSRSFHGTTGNHPRYENVGGNDQKQKPPCTFCNGPHHGIWSCRKFEQKAVEERWNFAKERQLSFRCLGRDHRGKDCQRVQPCKVEGCQSNHHRLLHRQPPGPTAPKQPASQDPPREGVDQRNMVAVTIQGQVTAGEQCSLRTVPVWLKANGKKVKVNALLDDASNETFLNENAANLLGIREKFETVEVNVLNNSVETFQSMPAKVEIESVSGEFGKVIEVKTCPHQVTGTYKVEDWNETKRKWSHLQQCDFPKPAKSGLVDLLIGVDNTDLHLSKVNIPGPLGSPTARLGPLGWTCVGPTSRQEGKQSRLTMHSFFTRETLGESGDTSCCDVNNALRKFWEIETYGTEVRRSDVLKKEEKEALKKVETTLSYDGTRYRLGTHWKEDRPKLPDNREAAIRRLESTEKSLNAKDSFVKKEYNDTIKSYVDKGYLRKLTPEEMSATGSWYLPHFPIVKLDKSTTRVRIVFDCSAKHDGISLNDAINVGPKLQNELFDVLVRFRQNPIGLACDIKEMYLQVEIEEKDRPYFRILWRDFENSREPDEYEFTKVVFGKNSAQMEAQYVAQQNARRHQDRFPLAATTVLRSTYMDDSIDSVEDESTVIVLQQQLQDLWNLAGMEARK